MKLEHFVDQMFRTNKGVHIETTDGRRELVLSLNYGEIIANFDLDGRPVFTLTTLAERFRREVEYRELDWFRLDWEIYRSRDELKAEIAALKARIAELERRD